ncbi:MAG: exodeoxyribonuclease V subunit beta, partial [Deltaproteobacteria bacterium]|nr:exodeoxyribonuclease V subunit beta [Deltaproteobacteria bacterium]
YTIEGIYLRLLLEEKMGVENILVVTFTEAATSELRGRIRDKIRKALRAFETGKDSAHGEDKLIEYLIQNSADSQRSVKVLKSALAQFDEARIFTIHGFCRRELLDQTFESRSRFDTEFIKDQRDLLSEIAQDFWRDYLYKSSEHLTAFLMDYCGNPQNLSQKLIPILNRPLKNMVTGLKSEDLDAEVEKAENRFSDLSETWLRSRSALEEILISHPGLSHNPYNKKNVPNWLGEMDHFIEVGNPFLIPKNLYRFSLETISQKFNDKTAPPDHAVFHICQELNSLLKTIKILLEKKLIDYGKTELKKRKEQRNLISFDDLLKNLRNALRGSMGEKLADRIREKYHVALIDEFQDTDPIQFEIFSTVFKSDKQPVFFIGDPKQSIYNFRGADIFAYLTAQHETETTYTLEKNWRSDNDLIQGINSLFTFHENPFLFKEIAFVPSTSAGINPVRGFQIDGQPQIPMHLWYVDDNGGTISKSNGQKKVTTAVAGEIARLLNLGRKGKATILKRPFATVTEEKAVAPKHIAVLVRRHGEAEAVQQALRKLSVPSVINTKSTVFDSPEFGEVTTLLKAIADPASERKVKSALAGNILRISGEQLHAYSANESGWERILEDFQLYRQTWSERGFYTMIRSFISKQEVRTRLLELEGGERKLTNLLHILELFHEAENNNRLGINGLLKWADRRRFSLDASADENEIRLETDDEAVKILTIHASKGLEFPIVFCPFSWGSAAVKQVFFHDPLDNHTLSLDIGSPDIEVNRQQAKREVLAEEIRLLYVALTRAKHRCYLVWGDINQTADSAMAYLFHHGKPNRENIWIDLEELEKKADGNIQLQRLPEGVADKYRAEQSLLPELRCLEFKGSPSLDWGISSFSGLSTKTIVNVEYPDRDRVKETPLIKTRIPLLDTSEKSLNMFSLPGGAKTGNCFHQLFENLDFRDKSSAKVKNLVRDTLQQYDFEERWQPVAMELVKNVLSFPLIRDEKSASHFTLGDLDQKDRISEMEFYFPLQHITSHKILDLLKPHLDHHSAQLLFRTMERLNLNEVKGFMKGFIDLIFHHDGRYYILDWKTNFLGDQATDYHTQNLQEYMINHSFILQYIIYTIALHRMLTLKLDNYDFRTHFGGVFYFFLRGVQKDPEPNVGVYLDNLHGCADMITALSQYLGGDR